MSAVAWNYNLQSISYDEAKQDAKHSFPAFLKSLFQDKIELKHELGDDVILKFHKPLTEISGTNRDLGSSK